MIEVLQFYSGVVTGGRSIPPGTYAEDDPALFGAASVMLAKGFARRLTVSPAIPADVPVSTASDEAIELVNVQHTAKPTGRKPKGGN